MTINKQELSITFTGSSSKDRVTEKDAIKAAAFIWSCPKSDLVATTTRQNEVIVTRRQA